MNNKKYHYYECLSAISTCKTSVISLGFVVNITYSPIYIYTELVLLKVI